MHARFGELKDKKSLFEVKGNNNDMPEERQ